MRESSLLPINFDMSNCPDLFPIVSALCTQAEGKSRLSGLSRLHIKESDRVKSMTDGLRKMGAQVKADYDVVEIVGTKLRGATVGSQIGASYTRKAGGTWVRFWFGCLAFFGVIAVLAKLWVSIYYH